MADRKATRGTANDSQVGGKAKSDPGYAAELAEWNKLAPEEKRAYNANYLPPPPGSAGGTGIDISAGLGAPVAVAPLPLTPEQEADKAARDG